MKSKDDYYDVVEIVPGEGADAEAGRVRLQARRLHLSGAGRRRRRCEASLPRDARQRLLPAPSRLRVAARDASSAAAHDHLAQLRLAVLQRAGVGALLALISSGLTIIYGTLGVLNLAHGAMFMLGGYAGYVAFQATGSFVLAVIGGALFMVVVGG